MDLPKQRIRAVALVLQDDKILAIYRENYGHIYWTFPAGGIEPGETEEQAAIRELNEETSIVGVILEKLMTVDSIFRFNIEGQLPIGTKMINEVFLVGYVSGTPALSSSSVEYQKVLAGQTKGNQKYEPQWVPIKKFLTFSNVFPVELGGRIHAYLLGLDQVK